MKKIFLLVLVQIFLLTFAACSNKETTSVSDISRFTETKNEIFESSSSKKESGEVSSKSESKKENSKVESTEQEVSLESAPEKTTEIILEGTPEEIKVRAFENKFYTVWIDSEHFYVPKAGSNDDTFITIKGRYDEKGSVNMVIMKNDYGIEHGAKRYRNFMISNYYTASEITDVENPKVAGTKHIYVRTSDDGLKKKFLDERISTYCVPISENESYTISLTCPAEAFESYGARLEEMYNSIEFK